MQESALPPFALSAYLIRSILCPLNLAGGYVPTLSLLRPPCLLNHLEVQRLAPNQNIELLRYLGFKFFKTMKMAFLSRKRPSPKHTNRDVNLTGKCQKLRMAYYFHSLDSQMVLYFASPF